MVARQAADGKKRNVLFAAVPESEKPLEGGFLDSG
jgi:hypothetical protein